jgi:hypothetical protein
MENVFQLLTLSSRTECTSGDLIAKLTSLSGRELLSFFRRKKLLILVHILFFLFHAGNMVHLTLVVIHPALRAIFALLADLGEDAGDC